jgi:hypothetical protein
VVARDPLAPPLEPRTLRRPGARHPAVIIQKVHFHGLNLKRAGGRRSGASRNTAPATLLPARCFVESDSGGDSLEQIPFIL